MLGVASIGVYFPPGRLSRRTMAAEWAVPAAAGQRAVAAADEDVVTMAVAAASRALEARPAQAPPVRTVIFGAPEPVAHGVTGGVLVAAALNLPESTRVIDVTGAMTCGVDALRVGADAIATPAGEPAAALVVVADCPMHVPGSVAEQLAADAAVAMVLDPPGEELAAELLGWGSHRNVSIGAWRGDGEPLGRDFEARLGQSRQQDQYVALAASAALASSGALSSDLAWISISSAGPAMIHRVLADLGARRAAVVPSVSAEIGDPGAVRPLLDLAQLIEHGRSGDLGLIGASGEGAEAFVVRRGATSGTAALARPVATAMGPTRMLRSYTEFVVGRELVLGSGIDAPAGVSPVAYWRQQRAVLRREALRCNTCDVVQYPPGRRCGSCGEVEDRQVTTLSAQGEIYTFTNDHLIGGRYSDRPEGRCVIDLAGGGRLYTAAIDVDPDDLRIGLPVELVLRIRGGRAGFRNYGWKARPRRAA